MASKKTNILAWIIALITTILFAVTLCLTLFFPNGSTGSHVSQEEVTGYKQQIESLMQQLETATSLDSTNNSELLREQIKQLKIELAASQTMLLTSENNQKSLEGRSTYPINCKDKYVYLTIDDCPSSLTPKILEVLKENDVKATFFVVYNPHKEYYKQIVDEGHTIALHTYTHDYSKVYSSVDAYFDDLTKISDYVNSITGIRSKIVRLPGGSSNTVSRKYKKGVITQITNELIKRQYIYYDWNAQTADATKNPTTPQQLLKTTKNFTTVNGVYKPFVMLLMHNSADRQNTIDALPSIISYYREQGYQFEVINEQTPAVHQPIQN